MRISVLEECITLLARELAELDEKDEAGQRTLRERARVLGLQGLAWRHLGIVRSYAVSNFFF